MVLQYPHARLNLPVLNGRPELPHGRYVGTTAVRL